MCGGMTIHLEPGWDTWTLLCTKETALTTTQEEREAAERTLPPQRDRYGEFNSRPYYERMGISETAA
jgi:hypothetical protein